MHGLTGGGWKRGNLRHRASPLPSHGGPSNSTYVQQSGHPGRKGGSDVTGHQVQGSQPVRVRSEETPGSSVAGLPASVERPASKWSDDHPLGVRNRPVRSMKRSLQRREFEPASAGQGRAEPVSNGRRPWKASGNLERALKNSPA